METENYKNLACEIVGIFDQFLEERDIDIPNPDKAQSENPCVIYGTDYGDLVDAVEAVLREYHSSQVHSSRKEAPAATPTANTPRKVDAYYAASVPLAVRLIENAATAAALKQPTPWMIFATGKGADKGKFCHVRMMQFDNNYEIHVNNGFTDCFYHRVCDGKTIVAVQRTLDLIRRDTDNGCILPF